MPLPKSHSALFFALGQLERFINPGILNMPRKQSAQCEPDKASLNRYMIIYETGHIKNNLMLATLYKH